MTGRIRIKKRHALLAVIATCSAVSFLFGFMAHAETGSGERFEAGDYNYCYVCL